MNRRTFLHAAGGTLAAACAARAAAYPRPFGAQQDAMQLPMQSAMRIALYDPTLARGQALARAAARMSVPAFALEGENGGDIGMLWHTQLARRVEVSPDAPVAALCALCALRASDRFVLERLAAPRRCIVLDAPQA
ncbi:MAG TPA: hypothetical protein VJS30_15770 [Paraburkholderia sp.]|nr:hypothetical protein [Paraburkholderia sp.]